ncbi:MAG: hypothetical protein LBF79_05565, partial [Dysgonamonadaceae bacterium]|nr:hypothetical protein [Dysgonamonadaceae bacterium]
MLITSIKQFQDIIPTASSIELDFREIQTFVEDAESWLCDEILGNDLYVAIEQLSNTNTTKITLQKAVCLRAYDKAIPFLDLVQTSNGFAVVSNSNQVPASKERVERLINWTKSRLATTIDSLFVVCLTNPALNTEWQKHALFHEFTDMVFLTRKEFLTYTDANIIDFEQFRAVRGKILSLQTHLAQYISQEQIDALLDDRRNNETSPAEIKLLLYLKTIVGMMYVKREYWRDLEHAINYMTSHPDFFASYHASEAYQVK